MFKSFSLKRKIAFAVVALLTVATIVFIFTNSMKDTAASTEQSRGVVKIVKPIVDPQDSIPRDTFETYTRKAAHFVEFFALGAEASALVGLFFRKRRAIAYPAAFALSALAAVCDELIQSSSDRSPEARDVLIDISGTAVGFIIVLAVTIIVIRAVKKRQDAGEKPKIK